MRSPSVNALRQAGVGPWENASPMVGVSFMVSWVVGQMRLWEWWARARSSEVVFRVERLKLGMENFF